MSSSFVEKETVGAFLITEKIDENSVNPWLRTILRFTTVTRNFLYVYISFPQAKAESQAAHAHDGFV